jgi:hypothetical protein
MKTVLCSALALIACVALLAAEPDQKMPKPQYDDKGQLVRPTDYREWMFLSAGYGMNYSPAPPAMRCSPTSSCSAGPTTSL